VDTFNTDIQTTFVMDEDQVLQTLKSSFLFNFRTGNVMVDTMVTGLIIMLSTYILNMFKSFFDKDWTSLFQNWKEVRESRIVISGKKLQGNHDTRLEYSTNFFAILHQIKKLNCVDAEIRELSEVPIEEPDRVSYDYDYEDSDYGEEAKDGSATSRGMGTNLIVSQSEPFIMTPEIRGSVNIKKETDDNKENPLKTEEFTISLSSSTLSTDQLRQTLSGWVKEYQARLNTEKDKSLRYFLYSPNSDNSEYRYDATSHYEEFKFESGKNFSNIFYPEKEDLIKRLDFFAENKDWYKERGIPYTMGFLFYGAPGCGKTSTIKAIANHTQRHIVSVPLNKIRTAKELLNIFYNVKMNYKDIPLHQRLYVLEDIDAADLKDVVGERNKEDESNSDNEDNKKEDNDSGVDLGLLQLIKSSATMGPLDKWKSSKLTLAMLLEVLDGVMEMDGRMLVITTNYPERLDKALIRPGRIDMKIKFNLCTAESIENMYKHFFETSIPPSVDISKLEDGLYTPAEVTQVFLNNIHSPETALKQLISQTAANIRLQEEIKQ